MSIKIFVIFLVLFAPTIAFLNYPSPYQLLGGLLYNLHRSAERDSENLSTIFTPGVECKRKCDGNDKKVCYFKWVLELYPSMSGACGKCSSGQFEDCFKPQCVTGNGRERMFMSINRQLPGPAIEVCQNDEIIVDVVNEIEGSSATIHWHGYAHDNHPFMDGVPYITQCPILFGSTFRYEFKATQDGTFFYHSHAGHQKANGVQGALIVRKNEKQKLFDYDLSEHVIVLSDWMDELTENSFPGIRNKTTFPQNILINGKGRFSKNPTNETFNSPLSVYHVDYEKRYRFRLIGASSNVCPLQLQIESHNFTVIATDSIDVKPFTADKMFLTAGERYDIVINADHKEKYSFWIKVSATEPCVAGDVEEFAVLIYHHETAKGEKSMNMMQVEADNPEADLFVSTVEVNSLLPSAWPITILESYIKDKDLIESRPKKLFFLSFGTPPIQAGDVFSGKILHKFIVTQQPLAFTTVGTINKISFMFPKVPLLSQHSEIDEKMFCNETNIETDECYDNGICFCTHRLVAPEHAIIEFVITNAGDPMIHPFHLHGHQFAVIETGSLNETFTKADLKKSDRKVILNKNPVYKDTISLPKRGFVRLRFRTQSANFLFFHCHYDFHLQIGMAGVLQVGEMSAMPKAPKDFPQCRDFIPK